MPYRYLTELSKSNETSTTAPANAHLFAADNSIQPGGDVTCGGATFSKIRTLDLSQIQHSTDDPAGLAQLIKASPVDTSGFSYDVYQDQQSGASFVTLAGKKVQEKNGRCVSYIDQAIHIEAELLPVMANPADLQRVSVQYENVSTPPPVWQMDPAWSYMFAIPSAKGLVARRKSLVKVIPNAMNPYYPPAIAENSFETLAAKANFFIGTTAINTDWSPATIQMQQFCYFNRVAPGCKEVMDRYSSWVAAVIATHLTTIE